VGVIRVERFLNEGINGFGGKGKGERERGKGKGKGKGEGERGKGRGLIWDSKRESRVIQGYISWACN
jgi:hypothetical protein